MCNMSKRPLIPYLLFIVTIATSFTPNNAEPPHIFFPSLPSHAPAHSPSHHHHHPHHPGVGHHHHDALAPSPSPFYASAPQPPAKPVTPSPSAAKAPTTHSTTPAVPSVKPPTTKAPTQPPAKSPGKAPTTEPPVKRKLVAVQGMVYCKKNCTYSGINTLLGASPLPGARVVLRCRNTKYLLRKTATTDKNGYFFLEAPPLLTTYGAHKCKVYLAHIPNSVGSLCSNATDINNGASGAYLFSNNTGPPNSLPTFSLFSVGPFAYESTKCFKH